MKRKTLFMETTQIEAQKTAGEVTSLLVAAGARQIATDYGEKGNITGLHFILRVGQSLLAYSLPARIEPVFKILNGRRKSSWDRTQKQAADRKQAERVAWRQLLRWIEAQLAMIDAGMVAAEEVFLPYCQQPNGQTVYEMFVEQQVKALPAPQEAERMDQPQRFLGLGGHGQVSRN